MIKTTDQLQCSVKRIREVKEKNIYSWHCRLYTGAVHFCLSESKWIHLDRFNRIIRYAATEKGATPTHPNDLCGAYVISMQKISIDDREKIMSKRKEEEAERKQQEPRTQEFSQLMGIIFGESANLKICNELNEHLSKIHHWSPDKFHNSNAWSDVKKFLGHPHADYPKGTLTSEQRHHFDCYRKHATTRNEYNDLVEKRKQFQEREDEQLERKRQEGQRQAKEMMRQNMRLEFY